MTRTARWMRPTAGCSASSSPIRASRCRRWPSGRHERPCCDRTSATHGEERCFPRPPRGDRPGGAGHPRRPRRRRRYAALSAGRAVALRDLPTAAGVVLVQPFLGLGAVALLIGAIVGILPASKPPACRLLRHSGASDPPPVPHRRVHHDQGHRPRDRSGRIQRAWRLSRPVQGPGGTAP